MSKNSTTGLSLEEIHAETLAELAGDAPETANEGDALEPGETPPEQPEGQNEDVEDVDLFGDLDETPQAENSEQPDEDSQTFTVDGKSVSLEEMRKGYLRQSDYTQKTQELAKERDELKDAKALWDAMNTDPAGTIAQLQRHIRPGTAPKVDAPKAEVDVDALVEARVAELLNSDPRIVEFQEQQAAAATAAAFSEVETEFDVTLTPNDRERVQTRMAELGLEGEDGIRVVTAALLAEVQAAKQRRKALQGSSTVRSGGVGSTEPKVETKIPESILEAFEMSQAEQKLASV